MIRFSFLQKNTTFISWLSRKLRLIPATVSVNQDGKFSILVRQKVNTTALDLWSTPRICEVTIRIIPHPITVFCVYAPSQVENSEEDLARKLEFWGHP